MAARKQWRRHERRWDPLVLCRTHRNVRLVWSTLEERGSEAVKVLIRQGTAVVVATVVLPDPNGS
ncbi:MAG TPA: hypothetical protein DIU18_02510 [Gemmatimonadetes bacterium]|nr:hypothetical protein [Gemmatimonadota bacterium]